jgi:hypothetical protein
MIAKTRKLLILSLALSWVVLIQGGGRLWAQNQGETVGLILDVDNREVEVGDKITVSIEFKQVGNGNSTVLQDPTIPTPELFQIRGASSFNQVTIINQQTAAVATTRYTLEATKAGSETLGPALLLYQDPSGKRREIKSNVVSVTVTAKKPFSFFGSKKQNPPVQNPQTNPPVTPDDQLRGIKPLIDDSIMAIKIIFWLVLVIVIAGYIWWRFSRPKKAKNQPVLLGKAAELREAWRKLSNEELSAKEFCLALSSLLRDCLQYRLGFPAVDYTTEEILKELKKYKLTKDEMEAVEKCLKTCDRVLYADGNLTGRDNLRSQCSVLLPKVQKS